MLFAASVSIVAPLWDELPYATARTEAGSAVFVVVKPRWRAASNPS